MSFRFDTDKLMKQVEKVAADKMREALEGAKRELGADGNEIDIRMVSPHRSGDKLDLGKVSFPSEAIKERFLQIVKRRMR